MKDKGKKLQLALTRKPYEKPVLIVISPQESRGKSYYINEFNTTYGPS